MKLKKIDWFLIIFLIIIIILTPIILSNPDFAEIFDMTNILGSNNYLAFGYWEAIGFLILVSIVGALIPIPIPYILPAAGFASAWWTSESVSSPFILIVGMIIFAALGNAIGDFLDYIIGKGAGHVIDKEDSNKTNKWSEIILKKPKAIPAVIVVFGLTPLPDSILLVPLGLVKYSMKKTLFWMYIGKLGMFTIVAIAGILTFQPIIDFLGESGDFGIYIGIILLYLIWIMIFIMTKKNFGESKDTEKAEKE